MGNNYVEVFASEKQADKFVELSGQSRIIPNVVQRNGVEVIVEEVGLGFNEMDRATQYKILADIAREMDFITNNGVYHLDIKSQHIGQHKESKHGVLIDWSDAYFYDVDGDENKFYMTQQPSNALEVIKDPSRTNLENSVKSLLGYIMGEIGVHRASQIYNSPSRFNFEEIADCIENS